MTVAAVSRFLAVLTVAALAGGIAVWVGTLTRARWVDAVRPVALPLAWLVSGVAVAGSLYYSEVAHFTPCRLCWFQRIGIYPLVVLLGVAVVRRRDDVAAYVLPLAVMTAPISIYHYLLQLYPSIGGESCDPAAPCSVRWVTGARLRLDPVHGLRHRRGGLRARGGRPARSSTPERNDL